MFPCLSGWATINYQWKHYKESLTINLFSTWTRGLKHQQTRLGQCTLTDGIPNFITLIRWKGSCWHYFHVNIALNVCWYLLIFTHPSDVNCPTIKCTAEVWKYPEDSLADITTRNFYFYLVCQQLMLDSHRNMILNIISSLYHAVSVSLYHLLRNALEILIDKIRPD